MPSLGTSFSSQGATPKTTYNFSATGQSGTTPQSKALNSYGTQTSTSAIRVPATQVAPYYGSSTPAYDTNNSNLSKLSPTLPSNLVSSGTPSTPLKKQTVTTPTGHTIVSEYHAPADNSSSSTGTTSGLISSNNSQGAQSNTQQSTQPAPVGSVEYDIQNGLAHGTSSQAGYKAPTSTNYAGLVGNLANQSSSDINQNTTNYTGLLANTAAGNEALGQNAQNIASLAGNKISELGQEGAKGELGFLTTGTSPVAQGNSALTAQTTAAEQQAVSQGAQTALQGNSQALTAQGQEQSGYNSAAGTSQGQQNSNQSAIANAASLAAPNPNTAYYGNPLTGGLAGEGNNLVNQGVGNALAQVANGTDPATIRSQLLSQYGAPAAQAFDTAMLQKNSGYNPTTASAVAGSNANQAATYKQQAVDLSTGLQNLQNAGTQAASFLQANGLLNPNGTPAVNGAISSYLSQKAPGAVAGYNSLISEIQKFQSQILSSTSGTTPTAQTQSILSTDPSKLSAAELVPFMQNLNQIGQNQLAVTQQTYGQLTNSGNYAGTPSTVNTTGIAQPTSGLSGITGQQAGQAGAGALLNIEGGISSLFSGVGSIAGKAAALFE